MVATLLQERLYTPQEYLEQERLAETRSEYVDGNLRDGVTSMPHTIISGNTFLAIGNHLKAVPALLCPTICAFIFLTLEL